MNSLLPKRNAEWRAMLVSVGLDPDDNEENQLTPIGIGNLAGKAVVAYREHDGMNQLGDEGGVRYNRSPYADYNRLRASQYCLRSSGPLPVAASAVRSPQRPVPNPTVRNSSARQDEPLLLQKSKYLPCSETGCQRPARLPKAL